MTSSHFNRRALPNQRPPICHKVPAQPWPPPAWPGNEIQIAAIWTHRPQWGNAEQTVVHWLLKRVPGSDTYIAYIDTGQVRASAGLYINRTDQTALLAVDLAWPDGHTRSRTWTGIEIPTDKPIETRKLTDLVRELPMPCPPGEDPLAPLGTDLLTVRAVA